MNYSYKKRKTADYLLMVLVFGLIAFGLIMIYSVSKYLSLQITNQASDKYYLVRQLVSLGIGVIVWAVFQAIDYKFWHKYTGTMLWITIVLLASVFLFRTGNGSRWINLFGLGFQPSEFAKLSMIIYLSGWLSSKKKSGDINDSFVPFLLFVGGVSLMMLIQKDLGTLSVILIIAASIFFAAGAKLQNLAIGGSLGVFLVWLAIKIEPYRMQRLTAFFNPNSGSLSTSYHIRNALIAIGSGGLWGLGFGQSRQKYLYLPEAQTDSIFPIIAEELGFLRASAVIIVYGLIAYRGYSIARRAPDDFSQLMAVGITTWIIWQTFVNLGAMMALLPLTGVPLPFISYGGTSLIAFLAAIGILLNISKQTVD
ncbi:MAG: putative lipid II flippase FtsW [Candidatus Berkelbacteria bacterium]|nr:putative lipid II flippase FtsW [Candidatus Berkelbacteria bacterium]